MGRGAAEEWGACCRGQQAVQGNCNSSIVTLHGLRSSRHMSISKSICAIAG